MRQCACQLESKFENERGMAEIFMSVDMKMKGLTSNYKGQKGDSKFASSQENWRDAGVMVSMSAFLASLA